MQYGGKLVGFTVRILKRPYQQAVGPVQQAVEEVLDQYLRTAAADAAFGGCFQIPTAVGIEGLYQLLQIYIDHYLFLRERNCQESPCRRRVHSPASWSSPGGMHCLHPDAAHECR